MYDNDDDDNGHTPGEYLGAAGILTGVLVFVVAVLLLCVCLAVVGGVRFD
jgi:hypothetical protein